MIIIGQIMKRSICFFFICFAWICNIYAQKVTGPFVSKPVYFDLSPTLSSLTAFLSIKKDQRKTERAEIISKETLNETNQKKIKKIHSGRHISVK
jgi:hypothetical protein